MARIFTEGNILTAWMNATEWLNGRNGFKNKPARRRQGLTLPATDRDF